VTAILEAREGKGENIEAKYLPPIPDKFEPHDPPTPGEKELMSDGKPITRPRRPGEEYRDERDAFKTDLPMYELHVNNNTTYPFMATPKGIATFSLNDVHGVDEPTVELHWLVAHDRGAGRSALELMMRSADKHGVTVQGYAVPLSAVAGKTMTVAQLEKFYEGFGFKTVGRRDKDGFKKIVRKPQKVIGDKGEWNEEKHERVPKGEGGGGRFGTVGIPKVWQNAKAIAALMGKKMPRPSEEMDEPEEPKLKLDPKAVDVGGDAWNKETAIRLESEYQTVRPALEEMLDGYERGVDEDMEGSHTPDKDEQPTNNAWDEPDEDEDDDVDPGEYEGIPEPSEWDLLTEDAQNQIESEYYDKALTDYIESENNSWQESGGALDQAKSEIADDPAEFVEDTLNEYMNRAEDIAGDLQKHKEGTISGWDAVRAPDGSQLFTAKNLAQAITLNYDSDGEGSGKLKIEFDDELLHGLRSDFDDPDQKSLDVGEKDYSKLLTNEMRIEISTVLKGEFDDVAESKAGELEPPDFTDQAKEYMTENWESNMGNDEKFEWGKYNTDIINEQQEQYEKEWAEFEETGKSVPGGGFAGTPAKFDPLNKTSGDDYRKTQRLARKMSLDRAAVVMSERKIEFGAGVEPDKAIARLDSELWVAWKQSSTSPQGLLLQVAVADELGGRLNTVTGRGGSVKIDRKEIIAKADREYKSTGGYEGIKAYVRAKWETTQFLLDKADLDELELYRGITLDREVYEQAVDQHEKEEGHKKVPKLNVVRNGAASTTSNADVANGWADGDTRIVLRALMPRTAAISIPAYGINVKSEQEVVVAGTAWKKWDAWIRQAPRFSDVAMRDSLEIVDG
jgi:hypothetical protein